MALLTSAAFAESQTPPERDNSQNNNDFSRAESLGQLTQPDFSTPIDAHKAGLLGVVYKQDFDTADFYSFSLPAYEWQVHFHLLEKPHTTMEVNFYDEQHHLIYSSQGADEEDFKLLLTAGRYFAEVATSTDVARGRLLNYTLAIEPRLIPNNDDGSAGCRHAPLLDGRQQIVSVSGSLANAQEEDHYTLFLPGDSGLSATRILRHFNLKVIDPWNNQTLLVQTGPTDSVTGEKYDPGFYCFVVGGLTSPGPANYQAVIGPIISGMRPSLSDGSPSALSFYDLGVLRNNGQYGTNRYISRSTNPDYSLVPGRPYKITEWLNPGETQWFAFDAAAAKTELSVKLARISALVRATVVDPHGMVVGSTSSNGTSLVDGYLPPQQLAMDINAGRYRLAVTLIGGTTIGTPYTMEIHGAPKH